MLYFIMNNIKKVLDEPINKKIQWYSKSGEHFRIGFFILILGMEIAYSILFLLKYIDIYSTFYLFSTIILLFAVTLPLIFFFIYLLWNRSREIQKTEYCIVRYDVETTLTKLKTKFDDENLKYQVLKIKKEKPFYKSFIMGHYQILFNKNIVIFLFPFLVNQTLLYFSNEEKPDKRNMKIIEEAVIG